MATLAAEGVDGWAFALAGVGAPSYPGAQSVDRFLEPGELVATVRAADAVLLPYRHATQSGAVVLAQALGTVPVVSAVGGIPEQVEDGVSGLLVEPDAGPAAWRERLALLGDDRLRERLAAQAQAAVWRDHEVFRRAIHGLTGVALRSGLTSA
jgi:glycosyltransferase involved in cell wall biosynthesis